jgi:hypothetical protein
VIDRLRPVLRRPVAARLALVLAIGLAVFTTLQIVGDDDELPADDESAATVAGDFALAVTTFDYRDAQGSIDRVLAFGDEGFEAEFRTAMGDDFLTNLEAAQSISSGRIVSGPTAQSSSDGVTSYLVIVDQTIASGATTTTAADGSAPAAEPPQVLHLGLRVTVDTESDKVTAVEVL